MSDQIAPEGAPKKFDWAGIRDGLTKNADCIIKVSLAVGIIGSAIIAAVAFLTRFL